MPGLVSSSFSWEDVTTNNIGFDFTFLNNRLTSTLDFYSRKTTGMLVGGQPLPAILGANPPNRNAADLKTYGFEFEVQWRDQLSKDLSYNASFNLSDAQSKITKYDLNPIGNLGDYYNGYKMGQIWGYVTEGFFKTDEEAAQAQSGGSHDQSYLSNFKWLAGDIKFKDLNNDGKISIGDNTIYNPGDRKIIGNSTPRFRFGLSGGVQYKDFDFTVFFQGVAKRDVFLNNSFFWGFGNEYTVPTTASKSYWTEENPNAYFPRQRFNSPNHQVQTKYLQNGAYIRLKQITLGYTVPKSITQKVLLERVRFYITGDNLWFYSKIHKSFDPEQNNPGGFPLNKTVSFGAQVSF